MSAGPLLWTRALQHGIEIMLKSKEHNNESSFEWLIRNTKRKIINTITSPYYKLKWLEVDIKSLTRHTKKQNIVFARWMLRDPLKINYMFRQYPVKCDLCTDGWDAIKDRRAYSYLWSKKIKTIKTDYTCDTKLFQPVEDYYNSGGEEGGLRFGEGATYEK
jgi:hypothetical protein|tara:strand:+ start:524 stop:1006 length:483 start_codon:yes stop_codon:yes gene_type:complete